MVEIFERKVAEEILGGPDPFGVEKIGDTRTDPFDETYGKFVELVRLTIIPGC
jgi:hypothetical protein